MPIIITNKAYQDNATLEVTNFYRANTGDRTTVTYTVTENIRVQTSPQINLSLDPVDNIITWNGGDWEQEGFRTGDTVKITHYSSNGTVINTWNTGVTYCNGDTLDVGTLVSWYTVSNNEIMRFEVVTRKREGLNLYINHVQQTDNGSIYSLIDGETTKFNFSLVGTVYDDEVVGVQIGNKSGEFECYALVTDKTTYPNNTRTYEVQFSVIGGGLYSQAEFQANNCLKLYTEMEWQSFLNEPFDTTILVTNDNADTGYFNEPYNSQTNYTQITTPVTAIDYAIDGEYTVEWNIPATFVGYGCAYISNDESYYKNKPQNQTNLAMLCNTNDPNDVFFINAPMNPDGISYVVEVTDWTSTSLTFNFKVNPNFTAWFDALDENNRNFVFWVKTDNVNLMAFEGNLTKQLIPSDPLIFEDNRYFDHSQNITSLSDKQYGYTADTEDDLAFYGNFYLPLNETFDALRCSIVAKKTDGEEFILNSVYYDFSAVPIVGGKQLFNMSQTVQTTLPTTSVKRTSFFQRKPDMDNLTNYGVELYFPFILRWEYWLEQTNANADFYPNDQTKNWFEYQTAEWSVQLKVELIKGDEVNIFYDLITIKDYADNADIFQDIQLYVNSTNQNVSVVVNNQLMKVEATHTLINGLNWDTENVWGMITVEPTEQSPRYILSTIVPTDFNPNNPLTPITGNTASLSFPTGDTAKIECFFNPSAINTQNGVKFTTKIKGCSGAGEVVKWTTDDVVKWTTDDEEKIKS